MKKLWNTAKSRQRRMAERLKIAVLFLLLLYPIPYTLYPFLHAAAPCRIPGSGLRPRFKNALWGLSVREAGTGAERISCNSAKTWSRRPEAFCDSRRAELFGPGYKFKTRVYVDGIISNGTLTGSL